MAEAAAHSASPSEQAVGGGAVAAPLEVHRQRDQVERAAAERELIPVDHPGDPRPVGQDVRQVQVVVGVVGGWQPQSPHRPKPAPQPGAQRADRRAGFRRIGPHLVPVAEQHVRHVAGEIAVAGRDPGIGLQLDQSQQRVERRPGKRPVHRVKGPPGKAVLDGHVPLITDHAVPRDRGHRITARPERGQVRRAPLRLLLRPVAMPELDDDRAGPLRVSGPRHPRLPRGHQRRATGHGLAELAGEQQLDLAPRGHPGHHARIVSATRSSRVAIFARPEAPRSDLRMRRGNGISPRPAQ